MDPCCVCESHADWLKFDELSNRDQRENERVFYLAAIMKEVYLPAVVKVHLLIQIFFIHNINLPTKNKRVYYSYPKLSLFICGAKRAKLSKLAVTVM